MKIVIETIPHSQQRYSTCGDWYYEDKVLHIKVSELGDRRFNVLVALHEWVEAELCQHDGVTQEMVDKFDMEFEKARHPDSEAEPGDETDAPYRRQHCIATSVERLMAAELGVPWNDYADAVESLP